MTCPKKLDAPEPKRRSRTGCWSCKARKVKCGEEKPVCLNCHRHGCRCDYSVRLNWERGARKTPTNSGLSRKVDSLSFGDLSAENASRIPVPPPGLPVFDASAHAVAVADHAPAADLCHAPPVSSLRGDPNPELQQRSSVEISPSAKSSTPISPRSNISPHSLQRDFFPSERGNQKQNNQWTQPFSPLTESQSPHTPNSYRSKSSSNPVSGWSLAKSREIIPEEHNTGSNFEPYLHTTTRLSWPLSPGLGVSLDFPARYQEPNQQNRAVNELVPCSHRTSSSGTISDHMTPSPATLPLPLSDTVSTSTECSTSTRKLEGCIANTPFDAQNHFSFSHSVAREIDAESPVGDQAVAAAVHPFPCPHKNLINHDVNHNSPDLDIVKNNDHCATNQDSQLRHLPSHSRNNSRSSAVSLDRNIQRRAVASFASHYYYAPHARISIPRSSPPLPSTLLESAINLLYFHHFINHTGPSLTRHDCLDNPFVRILPAMAVEDPNLMNLVLVLSAAHRARLLGYPVPSNRIAQWTHPVLPALRATLADPEKHSSCTNLATALMLITINMMFPQILKVPLSLQAHLKFSREVFNCHQSMEHGSERDAQQDAVRKFLSSWLGYVDIIGSLSCKQAEPALLEAKYLQLLMPADRDRELDLDCFSGFTPICGSLLRRLSELIHQCDKERLRCSDSARGPSEWKPAAEILDKAEKLRQDIINTSSPRYTYSGRTTQPGWKSMVATKRAFQLAGLIHLYRWVMGRASSDPEVQSTVAALTNELNQIQRSETSNVDVQCAALQVGCETLGPVQRGEFYAQEKCCEGADT
ncbi:hypothetical protein ACJ72_05003 [Emergomyces africanus]|uniref:Zn(2)-C6 fungal-type domain-containing protein n=1 Tax=Emergomyces africanus TaxID=1955775 RepID=A0A1B7NV75_9EURO|nr:hypothetical protein ACJ72_05003 [Emergomyces africanus]